jgi:hypothetical protein
MAAADAHLGKADHRTRLSDSVVTQQAVKAFYSYPDGWEWHLSSWNVTGGPGCVRLPRPVLNDQLIFDPDRTQENGAITFTRGRLTPEDRLPAFGNFEVP